MHHQRVIGAQLAQNLGDQRHQVFGINADHLAAGPGRIGDRPEHVEKGPHAQLAAHRHDLLHGRVHARGKQEGDADFLERPRGIVRAEVDFDAQRGQEVGGARTARHRAVAVFGHPRPGRGGEQRGAGRNVETALAVAAGAASVDQIVEAMGNVQHSSPHGRGRAGDLRSRFPLHGQGHQQRRLQGIGKLAVHQPAEQRFGRLPAQGTAGQDLFEGFLRCHIGILRDQTPARAPASISGAWGSGLSATPQRPRKLRNMATPASVSTDSGWN